MAYFTITGVQYQFGAEAFNIGQKVYLEKDEKNEFDAEAIIVYSESGMKLGHVANSVRTVAKGTHSAGWIAHLLTTSKTAQVLFIIGNSIIAEILEKNT